MYGKMTALKQQHQSNNPALLSDLLYHTLYLCEDAFETVTGRLLVDIVRSIPYGDGHDPEEIKNTFFNKAYTISFIKGQELKKSFEDNITDEQWSRWEATDIGDRLTEYLAKRAEAIPEFERFSTTANFLRKDYEPLTGNMRDLTDLAFYGLIFSALHDPNFASLCKDKSLDVSAMTFEEKMGAVLDHEAFYNRLLVRLGHDGAASVTETDVVAESASS